MSLDFVAGEFSPHNLPLQAVLGLLGFGERITAKVSGLSTDEAPHVEPARHRLDLALLGLLALHDALRGELERRGLTPITTPAEPEPAPALTPASLEADALRRLLR